MTSKTVNLSLFFQKEQGMSTILEQFYDVLKSIDANLNSVVEQQEIIDQFGKLIPESQELSMEAKAEGLAFSFADRFTRADAGAYFGPRVTMRGEDGIVYESPSLKQVQPEMIDYWRERAASVQHPFLVARYSGLAWDLASNSGNNADHALRKKFIQSSINLVRNKQLRYPAVGVQWLSRALEIASKFNDQEFFVPIKELALTYEAELNEQEKPGPWGFAYDLLMNNKRVNLSTDEEKQIIQRLEAKLALFAVPDNQGKTDPWACEHAASRLSEYYKKKNLPDEVKRVIATVGHAYEPLFDGSTALQVSGWMQKLHQLYAYHQLNEEAELLLKRLRAISAKAAEEMGGFEHKFTIPKEEADEMASSFYLEDVEKALEQIVARFIPDKSEAKQSLYDLAKEAPMQFAFPIQLTDNKGRVIANVGTLENDEDGHVLLRISEHLQFSAFFLHLALEKGKENGMLNKQAILTFLSQSAIINANRLPLLDKSLDYYFASDFIGFVHVAIPQIEEAIRNLVEMGGGKTLRYKDGLYQLRTFDDVLRDNTVASVCGENIQLYFRIVFTDPRGWNLRNDICHGLIEFDLFTKQAADRVLHTLLTIGMIRNASKV